MLQSTVRVDIKPQQRSKSPIPLEEHREKRYDACCDLGLPSRTSVILYTLYCITSYRLLVVLQPITCIYDSNNVVVAAEECFHSHAFIVSTHCNSHHTPYPSPIVMARPFEFYHNALAQHGFSFSLLSRCCLMKQHLRQPHVMPSQ